MQCFRRQPAYIDHRLAVMKADSRAIFSISGQAAKGADYLACLQENEKEVFPKR